MKKLVTLACLGLGLLTLSACDMNTMTAGEYNDTIVNMLEDADQTYSDYMTYATETSNDYLDKIQDKLDTAIAVQETHITNIQELGDYKGDDLFQQGAIAYLTTNKELLQNQAQSLINLRQEAYDTPDDQRTDDLQAQYETQSNEIYDQMEDIIDQQEQDLATVQAQFAAKHNYELEESTDAID